MNVSVSTHDHSLCNVCMMVRMQEREHDVWPLFASATFGPAALQPLSTSILNAANALAAQLPPSLAAPQAAPHLSALRHLAAVAATNGVLLPLSVVSPLVTALVERGAWREAVAVVGDMVQTHGAAAPHPALDVLAAQLQLAAEAVARAGHAMEAQQITAAHGLVRLVTLFRGEGVRRDVLAQAAPCTRVEYASALRASL